MSTKKFLMPFVLLLFIGFTSCGDDDDTGSNFPVPTGDSKTFSLGSVDDPQISGTATFTENNDNSTTITLILENTTTGEMHPAHIHFNTAVEGGDIALTLGTVDGDTGISSVTVTELNDGTSISYEDFLDYDGYINVHASADDLGTLLAQGDIGQNELTGTDKVFSLGPVAVPTISGSVTFSERVNGEALATIELVGTPDGGIHPAHIHANTAAEGGGILFSFNPVDGTTGISKTNVAALDDLTVFGYSDILNIDGYINVHLSADDLGTIVAQGDIGQNELTGQSIVYTLEERDIPSVSGDATFFERVNGTALAVINLQNTTDGGMHPAHIHANDAETGGPIIFSFPQVDGATGSSRAQVEALDDGTAVGYDDILVIDGYINVHLSMDDLATLLAQGNIGSNI